MGGEFPPPTHINPINNSALPQIPLNAERAMKLDKQQNMSIDLPDLPAPVDISPLYDKLTPPDTPANKLMGKPRSFNV